MLKKNDMRKCLNVTILGRTNAGKSTLLNKLTGARISAVTRKVQTTRVCIRGIYTVGDTQIIFSDVPGIFDAHTKLDKYMMSVINSAIMNSDAVMVVLDPFHFENPKIVESILKFLESKPNNFFILNKCDLLSFDELKPIEKKIYELYNPSVLLPISSVTGYNLDLLSDLLASRAPVGPWLYPDDAVTDLPLKFWAAEITREYLFCGVRGVVPYRAAIVTESWSEKGNEITINQKIYVNAEGEKAIVLGHEGSRIKWVGTQARQAIANAMSSTVHLFLKVEVYKFMNKDISEIEKYINYV